jgi:hypothetical protein
MKLTAEQIQDNWNKFLSIIDTYISEPRCSKLKAFYEKHKEEIIYIIYNCKEFMSTIKDNLSSLEDDNNIEL